MEQKTRNHRLNLKWTKLDIISITITLAIAIFLSIFVYFLPSDTSGAEVYVYYDGAVVTVQPLEAPNDKADPRYIILFKEEQSNKYDEQYPTDLKFDNKGLLLDDLIIEIKDGAVAIVEETSPNNICSKQGEISRLNTPLTCAPNYVVVMIKSNIAQEEVIPL